MEYEELFDWFDKKGREYPWRETEDTYKIFVTEVMLQKTGAGQVDKIYHDFFDSYPSVVELARAELDELEESMETLGLIKRARFLKKAAQKIVAEWGGDIPSEREELKKVKGIGRYTANAISCFAFEKKVPIVDANVARIIRRYYGLDKNIPIGRDKELWKRAEEILPDKKDEVKKFNTALIDLGALVCLNDKPNCEICPLKNGCSEGGPFEDE